MENQHSKTGSFGAGVFAPVTEVDFFANYWEKQPLHIARSSENPFEQLITLGAIEDLLSTNELFYPTVQLSHAGQTIPSAEYTDASNRIVSARVVERYHRGSTIVMTYVHQLRKELMDLCRYMQRHFMMRCQTNVYLSPAGNQGFNPHFDTHDVFILQVHGSKTFNFYSGGSRFPTSADAFNSEIHDIGSQTESIALSAGDTLYIPRGFTHDAVASPEEPSLHVTLGVYPILMHELLQEILHIGIAEDVDMASSPQTVNQLSKIMQTQIRDGVVNLALSRLRDSVALEANKDCRNTIQMNSNRPLSLCSTLSVNHDAILQLERSGDTVKLRTFGAVVEFVEPLSSAVEWLVEQCNCDVQHIPGVHEDERAALLEKLQEHDVVKLN